MRTPFRHVQNPLISGMRLKWYSNDKVMLHACLRLSHNNLIGLQVPTIFICYIQLPTILTLLVKQRPVRSQVILGLSLANYRFLRDFSKFPSFSTECHILFPHHHDVNIIAIFILSVDIFLRLFSLEARHYRFLMKICNACLLSYCIFLG